MLKQTEIIALNVAQEELQLLTKNGIHAFDGTIGYLTNLTYGYASALGCLPNTDIPKNFHEYQIAIIDLTNERRVPYISEQHQHKDTKTSKHVYLVCQHPQDLFDPRPYSLHSFKEKIAENLQKGFLIIIFCSHNIPVKYKLSTGEAFEIRPYDFLYSTPQNYNRAGKKTKIPREDGDIYNFLKKYNEQFNYEIIFELPERLVNGKYIPDPQFTPLVLTAEDKIAGISWSNETSGVFFLPKLENKAKFLKEFLTEVAPTLFPHLFPDIVKDKWLEEESYRLPNQNRLLLERQRLKKEFDVALAAKNKEIADNNSKYKFLSDMITQTGNELVDSIVKFLKWIGFDKAVDADKERTNSLKEEDINIETEVGLIIIEVKGIGGITTDSDCSQIGKVRTRRQKERNSFDVFGHFIVNHQRHIPPVNRLNPPFSTEQLQDAKYDSRGLITTWQLFNIYTAVEREILTKEQVKSCFYQHGYIDFIPTEMIKLGTPIEILSKISVIIIDLDGSAILKPNDKILYKQGDEFKTVVIKSIKFDNKTVSITTKGEYGLRLSEVIPKTAVLYAYPGIK